MAADLLALISRRGEEVMPDFIDGIDDFAKARWLHKRDLRLQAANKNNLARKERDREREAWVAEGKSALASLRRAFGGVDGILGPHRDHKLYCQQLDDYAAELARRPVKTELYSYSKRLIQTIRPTTKSKKVDMVRHWWSVMTEMRRGKDLRELFSNKFPNLLRALRIRERGERTRIPIAPEVLADLKEKRAWKRKTLSQLKLIRDTRQLHASIPDCQSLLHFTPAGCPKCGVIHIGGSRDVVQYVRSVNRYSGVITLQTLGHELEALDLEESEELHKLAEANEGIEALEKALFIRSRDTIQAWWPCVLAKWRAQRAAVRMNRSVWFFRIRRLVKMKRLIDTTDNNQLDFDFLVGEFPDVRDALEEYIKLVQDRRNEIAERVAKTFLTNLRKAVALARKKEYLRLERNKNEGKARDLALSNRKRELLLQAMRKRVLVLERRKFKCIRPRCCGREFASQDRYNTHMGLHKIEDDLRAQRVAAATLRWAEHSFQEEVCLHRVNEIHSNVVRDVRAIDKVGVEQLDVRIALIQEAIDKDGDPSFATPTAWSGAGMPHLRLANAELNTSIYHLEKVSLHGECSCADIICLDQAIVRIGTLPSLECTVVSTGAVKRDAQISKVHCIIYCPFAQDADAGIVIVDNNTRYGTYIVSDRGSDGATKVSNIVTEGTPLVPGDLLCIGVRKNGTQTISAVEASGACIVFRVKCRDKEGKGT